MINVNALIEIYLLPLFRLKSPIYIAWVKALFSGMKSHQLIVEDDYRAAKALLLVTPQVTIIEQRLNDLFAPSIGGIQVVDGGVPGEMKIRYPTLANIKGQTLKRFNAEIQRFIPVSRTYVLEQY